MGTYQTTTNQGYQKPHPGNTLAEDVDRLRSALDGIDADMASKASQSAVQSALDLRAPLASPTFTGTPAAPTAAADTNTTQIATTAYVVGQGYLKSSTASSTYAPLASPQFTGAPTAPTAAVGTDTTQLATVAYVNAEIANDAPTKTGGGASGTWGISITGTAASASAVSFANVTSKPSTLSGYGITDGLSAYSVTATAASKTLANRERCTVVAAGLTITLPGSPAAGSEVSVTVISGITNTTIARNGQLLMGLSENLIIDIGNTSVTLYYVDSTRGWRMI